MRRELLDELVWLSDVPAGHSSVLTHRSERIAVEGVEFDIADTLRAYKR